MAKLRPAKIHTARAGDALAKAKDALEAIYAANGHAKAMRYLGTHLERNRFDLGNVIAALPAGGSLLDLGSAPFAVPWAAHLLGYDVTAGDYDPEDWLDPALLPFRTVVVDCDGVEMPLESEAYDAVMLTEVFEHLHINPIITVREVLRILKPGGFFYLTTPNLIGLRKWLRMQRKGRLAHVYGVWASNADKSGPVGHVREYTPREIGDFLKDCGFARVEVTSRNVYMKNPLETYLWRALTWPLASGKETVVAMAWKAA